jgi:hypothetical protein
MARTAVGHILLQEIADSIDGSDAGSIIEVYRDKLDQPLQKPATSIGGLDVNWLSLIPASLVGNLWGSFGTPTEDNGNHDGGSIGNSIVESLTGGDSSYSSQTNTFDGNHYVWSNLHLVSGYRLDGDVGTNGDDGTRGAGTFFKNVIMFEYTSVPAVGSAEFNQDAMQAVCEAQGGVWNISCDITNGLPRVGDVVTINYFDHTGTTPTAVTAVHDGTGILDSDWSGISTHINGDLLVNGTVVADSIVADYVLTNDLQGGAKTSSVGNDGNAGYYFDSNGDMAIGDGTNDLTFVSGVLGVPANALTTVTTPADTLVHFEQSDSSKYTLQVGGGRGFLSEREDMDLTGIVSNSTAGTSVATFPIADLEDDAVYVITSGVPSDISLSNNSLIEEVSFVTYVHPSYAQNTLQTQFIGDGAVSGNSQSSGNVAVNLFGAFLYGEYDAGASTYSFRLRMDGDPSMNTGGAMRTHPILSIKRLQ